MNQVFFHPGMMLLLATGMATATEAAGGNPVYDLRAVAEKGEEYVLPQAGEAEVYADRQAGVSLGHLRRDRPVVVLAIDRFGLQVRGVNRAGPVTGWIGWRQALLGHPETLAALERFFGRLEVVERLIAKGQPAIGMTAHELERALGKATIRRAEMVDGHQTERLEWVREESVPVLAGLPGLARDEPLLTLKRETGRLVVVVTDGVASSVEVSDGRSGDRVAQVPPPCPVPFLVRETAVGEGR